MSIYEERFKPLFLSSGMTDKDLEAAIGLPRGIIYKWEHGVNKSFEKYCGAVAKHFSISADYLLGTSEIKKPTPVSESGQIPNYELLNPENRVMIEELIDKLLASQSDLRQ